jgi:selenocysteine lyase/cysteine desulfurase
VVTTLLEHPSVYDAAAYNSRKHGMELRVAGVNKETGGVDADAILDLVDKDTSLLACMAASNISGSIYETEKICKEARKINPDIVIYVDAVQHAPHGVLDPEKWGADVVSFAPYKFFGARGFGLAHLSERVSRLPHHRLLGKAEDDWEIGSPATAHFAVITQIVNYVADLGRKALPLEESRRKLFEAGMKRIADHERGLLDMMLEGFEGLPGLRRIPGVRVRMDGKDLTGRDLILGIEFDRLDCRDAVAEYEKRGVIAFERALSSIYSKRMVEAFDSRGMVRLSPLHVNTPEDIRAFLKVTKELARL